MDMTDTDSGVYMMNWQQEEKVPKSGAGNEARTRDLNLGKVALYRLSYSRPLICAKNLFTICSERLSAKGRSAGTGAYLIYVRIPSTARYRLTGAQYVRERFITALSFSTLFFRAHKDKFYNLC